MTAALTASYVHRPTFQFSAGQSVSPSVSVVRPVDRILLGVNDSAFSSPSLDTIGLAPAVAGVGTELAEPLRSEIYSTLLYFFAPWRLFATNYVHKTEKRTCERQGKKDLVGRQKVITRHCLKLVLTCCAIQSYHSTSMPPLGG